MGLTGLHDSYGSWHLYICRFLFGFSIFLSLHSCYEGHFVLFCKEKIESLDRVMANIKVIGLHDFRCYLHVADISIICHMLEHNMLQWHIFGVLWPLCYHRRGLFVCRYREVFWEEFSRLTWRELSIQRPLLFWVHVIILHSLPSRVNCSFQG